MGRLLGIDYGRARVGVAVSDETRLISRPLSCLEMNKGFFTKLKQEIQSLLPIDAIVVGLPLNLNGQDSPMTQEVRKFAEELHKQLGIPIQLWDERLTTAQVTRTLQDAGMNRKKRAEKIDSMAAALILQSFLDSKRPL